MENLMDILHFQDTASRVAAKAIAKARAFKLDVRRNWKSGRLTRHGGNRRPGSHPEQQAAAPTAGTGKRQTALNMPASLAVTRAITLFETRRSFARHARLNSTFAYRPGRRYTGGPGAHPGAAL
jgi:hypothetical protein